MAREVSESDVMEVSPALAQHAKSALAHGVWKRSGLSARDRSLITVAALIARDQTVEMVPQFARAMENGVSRVSYRRRLHI